MHNFLFVSELNMLVDGRS